MAQPIRELHSETNKEVITLLLHQLNIIILHMCSCNIVPVSIETKLAKVLDIGTSALHCKPPHSIFCPCAYSEWATNLQP